jgi:hypothetical protein
LSPPVDSEHKRSAEWLTGPARHAAGETAAAAAERHAACRTLGAAALAAGVTGAVVVALILINPAVEASVETSVPAGTIELAGDVTSQPVLAKLGVLELGWTPFGPQSAHPIKAQVVLLKMHLSSPGCERLAQIAGACGVGPAVPLRHLESLRLAATEQSLRASVTASAAPRTELEPIGERARSGSPSEWSLRNYSPAVSIELNCEQRVAIEVTALSDRPATPKRGRTVACSPGGPSYRVAIVDAGRTVTNIGFHRLLQFQMNAAAEEGALAVGHGRLRVDGDVGPLEGGALVGIAAEPGSTLSSSVVSPAEKGAAEVVVTASQASRAQVGGEERTPNEFERIPIELRLAFLAPLAVGLLGMSTRAIRKLRPWERNHAPSE